MITADLLAEKRETIVKQRDNALALYHQAVGALALIENLLPHVDGERKAMTLGEFAKSVGADSAEIVPASAGNGG